MPPHEEINPECNKIFMEFAKNDATLQVLMTNHIQHDIDERKVLRETLDTFNERIKDLPEIKGNLAVAKWVAILVLVAVVSGYIAHIL